MATESPSWTDDEDQPWDTELEFDDAEVTPSLTEKPAVLATNLDNQSSNGNTLKTSDIKKIDPARAENPKQNIELLQNGGRNIVDDSSKTIPTSGSEPTEDQVVAPEHPGVLSASSFVDSNVLDSEDEEPKSSVLVALESIQQAKEEHLIDEASASTASNSKSIETKPHETIDEVVVPPVIAESVDEPVTVEDRVQTLVQPEPEDVAPVHDRSVLPVKETNEIPEDGGTVIPEEDNDANELPIDDDLLPEDDTEEVSKNVTNELPIDDDLLPEDESNYSPIENDSLPEEAIPVPSSQNTQDVPIHFAADQKDLTSSTNEDELLEALDAPPKIDQNGLITPPDQTSDLEQKDYGSFYGSHSKDDLIARIEELEATLGETEAERDSVKDKLEGFLSKISSMKAVFQNYKETQEELEVVKADLSTAYEEISASGIKMDELEQDLKNHVELSQSLTEENTRLTAQNKSFEERFASLNTESSDLNFECERLSQQLTTLQREYQSREESLQDEKYTLENEVSKLNKKLSEQRAAFSELEITKEEVAMKQRNLELVVEELKESLEEKEQVIEEFKSKADAESELSKSKVDDLLAKLAESTKQQEELRAELTQSYEKNEDLLLQKQALELEVERFKSENERILSLEEDVQSKQVIIGKLRHEAIILNEHLTKSLSMLRQQLNEGEGTVDKELISNMLINFLQIPRGDTKKFEALQVISDFLDWDDTRNIQAGLANRGAAERGDEKPARLTFISLWTDFLDKESSKK